MATPKPFDDLGLRLRTLIERKRGLRQVSAIAREAGLSPTHLDQILTGRRSPRLGTLERVLMAIPASGRELFADSVKPPHPQESGVAE